MAAALLGRALAEIQVAAEVSSAGLISGGSPATPEGVEAMAAVGLDTTSHRSRQLSTYLIDESDLVLAMAREHARAAVEAVPPAWPRTFTLKELVRRAESAGPRMAGEPLGLYLDRLHEHRTPGDMLGSNRADDVADPIGRGGEFYTATAAELDALVRRLVELVWKDAG